MRLLLLLVTFSLLVGTVWFATTRGTEQAYFLGAPQIEQRVGDGVRQRIAEIAGPGVGIIADGRHVQLSGQVESEAVRDEILAAARTVPLLGQLSDRLAVIAPVRPFPFSAELLADGGLVLRGHVPSNEAETRILSAARLLTSGASVRSELALAGGAPDGDWTEAVLAGMKALGGVQTGTVRFVDFDATLIGEVSGGVSPPVIDEVIAATPWVRWEIDLAGVLPLADPYVFTALKTEDGAVIIGGNAPDAATRQVLLSAATELSDLPLGGELTLAAGMPSADWPERVRQGLHALSLADSGFLNIQGLQVEFTARTTTQDKRAEMLRQAGETWIVTIEVARSAPVTSLRLLLEEDGTLTAHGRLPAGLAPAALGQLIEGVVPGNLVQGDGVDDIEPGLAALGILLPRLETAVVLIGANQLTVRGALLRGFSAEGAAAAIRADLPGDWLLTLDLTEAVPMADLVISMQDGEIALTGLLPAGLPPAVALDLLGDSASGEALSTGGEGDVAAWTGALESVSEGLVLFTNATGRMTAGTLSLDGTLRPGYDPNQVQAWLAERVTPGWRVGLTATQSDAAVGDTRIDLLTGQEQTYQGGFWVSQLTFPVSKERCDRELTRALSEQPIQFVPASDRIDQNGRAVLDRLAAVATRCLKDTGLRLVIAGHTDADGEEASNQALSEARATAVLDELIRRGVGPEVMTAIGYGETEPVADNATQEGRAQNRRIEFEFADGEP